MKDLRLKPTTDILLIKIPKEYSNFIIKQFPRAGTFLQETDGKSLNNWNAKIPNGNYTIINKLSNVLTDEAVCKSFVKTIPVEEMPSPHNDMSGGCHYAYIDYMNQGEYAGYNGDAGCFSKAVDSFKSMLEFNNINMSNEYLILKCI